MKRQACTSATLDGGRFLFAIAHVDTCLRRYDLVLVDTYHCLRRYDATLEHTVSFMRRSSVAPAEAGAHLSNAALKLALLAKAFAALYDRSEGLHFSLGTWVTLQAHCPGL